MKFLKVIKLVCLVLTIFFFTNVYSQNSIKFSTEGQQYGVADLDHFWISPTKDINNICCEKRMEYPDEYTVGHEAGRANAKDGFVWDQFGCAPTDPWPKKSGWVRYDNVPCEGKQYIQIQYSKHSSSTVPIEIFVNDTKQGEFIPDDQGDWNKFTTTYWIEINFPPSPIISGYTRVPSGAGISGVTLSFSNDGGTTTTNSSGYYSQTVNYGWSGTVTPTKSGYTFAPLNKSYTNVTSDQTDQNYTGTPETPSISGYVRTSNGTGISEVTLSFSNNGGTTTTNSSGYYSQIVNYGWSGTVTPTKSGYTFAPLNKSYTNVTSNQTDQNYTANPETPSIAGYVRTSSGTGISVVTLSFTNNGGATTTNSSGYYSQNVNYGWSGTATPNKTGYTFDPSSRSYSNVINNMSNQNYTAIPVVPSSKSIKFYTEGQQNGVADLDHFWISSTKQKSNSIERRCETPDDYNVGHIAWRSNAIDQQVWDQFGCGPTDPWPKKSGWVRYDNVPCEGKQYIKIQYSKHSSSIVPIKIYINDTLKAEFMPIDQGDWNNFTESEWIEIDCTTAVFNIKSSQIINSYILYDNYPNPFNSSTTIRFYLPFSNEINLSIYNINGNLVKEIFDSNLPRGEYHAIWDGTDNYGSYVSSGMYLCRLSSDNISLQKKLLFIK